MTAGGIVLLVFAVLAVVVAIVLLFQGVRTVPQGWEWTVEKFGQYTRVLKPGLNFMFPIVERVGARINMQESVLDIPQQQVITKDNAIVSVDGVAFYQVVDARAAAYEVRNLVQAITNLALTNIRNVMGSLALDDVLSKRNEINDRLLSVIDHATNAWGIKVLRIELKDIIPPQDMVQAMARQMKAERDKRAQILEAEGFRAAEITKAEGAKQSQILQAEGRREAAFRDAEARERAAEAEAKATQVVTAAIGSGGAQAINYFLGQKYVEALHAMGSSNNSKVFFLPVESAGIMGTLGGLAELTKESSLLRGGGTGGSGAPARLPVTPPSPALPPSAPPSGPWDRS
ncbi:SPFH domain-containing protein [Reyranella sp. CPCC 100927]|uniref:SPFH domain-containing protein n=1 Tax=Reyranella sp. CPCC 100927 TaxID=2599616 RepID=UPI0011B3ACD6|nr:SPFH domain-containing protein [Reyranella sp. CPCC 100927]TWT10165.1 SPFH/Band 7/PHB domain protein [Reyranella sp. CPCC 100927]